MDNNNIQPDVNIKNSSCEEYESLTESPSCYSYWESSTPPSKKELEQREPPKSENLIYTFEEILQKFVNTIIERNKPRENKYKYEYILANIDWMLQQLPENKVTDINCRILTLIHNEIENSKI